MFVYPSAGGRVKWLQKGSITVRHYIPTEERQSSRRARVQEELNMIHYPRAAACLFSRLQAEVSSDFIEEHCDVPSRERPYEIVISLCVCVFDLWYFRVRVSLRMWQGILRPIGPLLCTAQIHLPYYISKLIATQSSSPYTVVRVLTLKVIVIVLLIWACSN